MDSLALSVMAYGSSLYKELAVLLFILVPSWLSMAENSEAINVER